MTEIGYIVFMALSGILFALGGTISTEIRRTWLPLCTFVFLAVSKVSWKFVEFGTGVLSSFSFLGAIGK